jgi:hemolysin type calcium-binding protein
MAGGMGIASPDSPRGGTMVELDSRRRTSARRPWSYVAVVLVATLALCSAADAAVTIGSDLSRGTAPPENWVPCLTGDHNCTLVQTVLPGRPLTSPIDGVMVRWRIKHASSTAPFRVRVGRPAAGGAFTGAGTQEIAGFSCPDVCTLDVRLPVKAGDYAGVDASAVAVADIATVSGANLAAWSPFLVDGQTRPPDGNYGDFELLMNADIEPDADADGFGDETQDFCATQGDPANSAPCGPPRIRGKLRNGRKLTARGDATGSPSEESFRWLRCNARGIRCVRRPGGASYKLTSLDVDHTIRVVQHLTSTTSSATARSGPTKPVAPRPGRCSNKQSGTARRDRLRGTTGGDLLRGRAGNDVLVGGPGGDCLSGEAGNDTLVGGPGRDLLSGGPGRDVCRGDRSDRFLACERILGR